jgi:TIR domain
LKRCRDSEEKLLILSAKTFFCYARQDKGLRDELEMHLANLKRLGQITSWHDQEIGAGKVWEHEINSNLNTADIILLLISPSFIHSDYCYGVEMKRALERHEAREAHVIPIILRPVDWEKAPFSHLQFLPSDGRPVTKWRNRDVRFLHFCGVVKS